MDSRGARCIDTMGLSGFCIWLLHVLFLLHYAAHCFVAFVLTRFIVHFSVYTSRVTDKACCVCIVRCTSCCTFAQCYGITANCYLVMIRERTGF